MRLSTVSAKYPRSFHLPWSPGGTRDDKRMASTETLYGVPIVITEKLDGSNMAMTRSAIYARSHSGPPTHPSFAWAKALHARVCGQIDVGLTLFGEYCYAVHSIVYEKLPGYFFLFGVRDDATGEWWDWDAVETQAEILGLPVVPVLFRGAVPELEPLTRRLAAEPSLFGGEREGMVVRVERKFADDEFGRVLGKYVRAGHVQTDEHWMFQEIRVQRGPAQV
jgi:hypothetical protein